MSQVLLPADISGTQKVFDPKLGKVVGTINNRFDARNNGAREATAADTGVFFPNGQPNAPTTIESLGRVKFNVGDIRTNFDREDGKGRSLGISRNDFVFPEKLHGGGLPFIKIDVFEVNSVPGVTSTVQNRSAASFVAGAGEAFGKAKDLVGAAVDAANQVDFVGKVIDATGKVVDAAGDVVDSVADTQKIKERVSSLFKDFSLNRYSDTRVCSIALPIPEGLNTQYTQDYNDISLTSAFGNIGFAAQALAEPKFLDRNDPYLGELAATLGSKALGSSADLTNLLTFGASGRVVNPQMEMLYRSPTFREFVFDFRLVPRNAYDTLRINEIIRELKYRSSPTFCGTTTGRYYVPPARFAFTFFNADGTENEFLFSSKQCVMTNISLDYAPNGYATHRDGSPVEIRLQIQMKETAMITAEDFEERNY